MQLCFLPCAQNYQYQSCLLLNLCIISFYIFVSVYVFFEVSAFHWLLHFCCYIWGLCMPLIATFLSSYLRFVYATDCYIFVATFEVCACHWLLHFCHDIWGLCMPLIATFLSSWNIWWGEEIRTKFGVWYVCRKKTRVIMWFRHWHYMGACFQASHCCTHTMTDGNALCSLISFILQHITSTKSYNVSTFIWWKRIMIWIIIVQIKWKIG